MPRPGPRPYVCEKRAWHSDRHKPMRGSLIKEIFRVASEIHSPATRKNKEWQEKLPVVVLKAEEIMYSKANSEAEYLDLRTLKDRTNDAINTIIKRDENAETGHFLQPCIEAALNLGCTPRRTLRSQRYNNPRCYLNIGTEEEGSPAGRHQTISPACFSYYADLLKSKGQNVMMHSGSQLLNPITENGNKLPLVSENQSLHMNECPGSNSYAVYPLYYVDQHRSQGPKQGFPATPSSCPPHMLDPPKKQCGVLCDLSLRLGVHFPSVVDRYNQELDSGVGYTSHEGHKSNDPHTPQTNGVDTLKRNLLAEGTLLDTTLKKQKAGLGPSGDQLFRWQPKAVRSYLSGRMKSSGLLG